MDIKQVTYSTEPKQKHLSLFTSKIDFFTSYKKVAATFSCQHLTACLDREYLSLNYFKELKLI